jgi:hypothetical protein
VELLREFIRAIVQEDAGTLSTWASKSKHQVERDLEAVGLTPVPRGTTWNIRGYEHAPSFIGKGAFASAYEVLYKGRRAVAKVTKSKQDARVYREIMQDRAKLPPKVARHLPIIYDVIDFDLGDREKKRLPTWIVVTEFLVPMSNDIVRAYFGEDWGGQVPKTIKGNAAWLIDNPERLSTVIDSAIKFAEQDTHMPAAEVQKLKKLALDPESKRDWKLFVEDMLDDTKDEPHANLRILKRIFLGVGDDVLYALAQMLRNEIMGYRFPTNLASDVGLALSSKGSKVQDLLNALDYMSRELGWDWADMHAENVMMRPKTGELVVADVGLWEKH